MLLVDAPPGGFVWNKDSLIPREVDHGNDICPADSILEDTSQKSPWYPPYNTEVTLLPSSGWPTTEQAPSMQSLFDDILLLYPLTLRQSVSNPKDCTDICRNLVLSAWTARLRIVEAQIIQELHKMSAGAATDFAPTTWLDNSWSLPWQPREFGRLMRAKAALEAVDADLYRNIDALGIGATAQTVEAWEADAWKSLQNAVRISKTRVEIISQAYTQAVSVRESITSNKQARQVGFLTSLATLFIPISFIAAIFSMGGDFSAGASRFWVYWAIAIPVVLFGCILLFTRLGRWVLLHGTGEESLV